MIRDDPLLDPILYHNWIFLRSDIGSKMDLKVVVPKSGSNLYHFWPLKRSENGSSQNWILKRSNIGTCEKNKARRHQTPCRIHRGRGHVRNKGRSNAGARRRSPMRLPGIAFFFKPTPPKAVTKGGGSPGRPPRQQTPKDIRLCGEDAARLRLRQRGGRTEETALRNVHHARTTGAKKKLPEGSRTVLHGQYSFNKS